MSLTICMTTRLAKIAGQGVLGLAILGWVAGHCGSPNGTAVVHVIDRDVDVTIGGSLYRAQDGVAQPLVCLLPKGRHDLTARKGGRVVREESFDIQGEDIVVLTVWDPERHPDFEPR